MHSWLAKPLDWCAIQLACRCVKNSQAIEEPVEFSLMLKPDLITDAADVGVNLTLAEDGTFHFPSPIKTSAVRNNTVFGRFFPVEDRWTQFPTAILLHGWNAELCYRHLFPYLASLLRRARINTAMIELPYHMQRRPSTGPMTDFISSDVHGMMEATRQAIADTLALGNWIRAQGGAGFGVWGFSLGAWLAGLIATAERSLFFAVLTTPIARIDRAMAELPFCEPARRRLENHFAMLEKWNLGANVPALDPQDILLVQSRHDLFAPPQTVEQLWELWQQPEIWRVPHGHISVLMSTRIMKRTVGWIRGRMQRRHQKAAPTQGRPLERFGC